MNVKSTLSYKFLSSKFLSSKIGQNNGYLVKNLKKEQNAIIFATPVKNKLTFIFRCLKLQLHIVSHQRIFFHFDILLLNLFTFRILQRFDRYLCMALIPLGKTIVLSYLVGNVSKIRDFCLTLVRMSQELIPSNFKLANIFLIGESFVKLRLAG